MAAMLYDVIVVGAGVEGSATAYNSAQDGYSTLLLEQFPLPHTRGSSHGQSRTIRKAYNKVVYARMMDTAYAMWGTIEQQEGMSLIKRTGGLTLGPGPSREVEDTARTLARDNAPHRRLTGDQTRERFPAFRVDSHFQAVYDPATGVMKADKALACLWSQFRKRGGVIRDGEPVVEITPGKVVVLTTPIQQYRARSVVICAGPWTSRILKPLGLHLALEVQRAGVFYWKNRSGQPAPANNFYMALEEFQGSTPFNVYGLPSMEYPDHIKLCLHGGPIIDPDERDSQKALDTNRSIVEKLKAFVQEYFPGLEPEPSIQEACIYTVTPDEDFVLDKHPHWENIVIGAGFSGHGFKLAPVVGKVLAQLATGRETSFDVEPFKICRFNTWKPKL